MFSKLFSNIASWKIWGFVAAVVLVLFGFLKIEKYKNAELEDKVDEVEDALEQGEYNHAVVSASQANEADYRRAKDKADEASTHMDDDMAKPYST